MKKTTALNSYIKPVWWQDIRNEVQDKKFKAFVDELDSGKDFKLFKASYPYGEIIVDTVGTFIPDNQGGIIRLSDPSVPKSLGKYLSYGQHSAPLAIVLDKHLELFMDLPSKSITIPWAIYKPGSIFPFGRIFNRHDHRIYAPNSVLSIMSGTRSTFMLPNIGCSRNHSHLQRDYNIRISAPKSLYDHGNVFKQIARSAVADCNWQSSVLFFSEQFVKKLNSDKKWESLKLYLYECAWNIFEFENNRVHYDIGFSMIQEKRNLKPSPYLVDTAKHLFLTGTGDVPGYIPATNNDALPVETIQKAFHEAYGLRPYLPTIMQPHHFGFEKDRFPIYYSLQYPSTFVASPKSRKEINSLFEMRELEHIMNVFIEEMGEGESICSDTILGEIARKVNFTYYHNREDSHTVIKPSHEIDKMDSRFKQIHKSYHYETATTATSAPFMRGCVKLANAEH